MMTAVRANSPHTLGDVMEKTEICPYSPNRQNALYTMTTFHSMGTAMGKLLVMYTWNRTMKAKPMVVTVPPCPTRRRIGIDSSINVPR